VGALQLLGQRLQLCLGHQRGVGMVTEREAMATLDEDGVSELHNRIRRARNKYTGQYRRGASARVTEAGGRGKARPANARNAARAEVFEEALNRVSRRLAALSRQSVADLRAERLAAAKATGRLDPPAPSPRNGRVVTGKLGRTDRRSGD